MQMTTQQDALKMLDCEDVISCVSINTKIAQSLNIAITKWSWKLLNFDKLLKNGFDAFMRVFFRHIHIEVYHKSVLETLSTFTRHQT